MTTVLQNRANVSRSLEEESRNVHGPQKHISIAIMKEVLSAKQRGWDASRISKEFNVDHGVIQKLGDQVALPMDDKDGIV